eukprot:CAMPEP_0198254454 /NCGR_PEP_ID=MMETSP1447-20131203/4747_1 /TAXON_ID=420782 /ORGANISM="Chaetoceros dichaeta, Strain CCMP1751" /LENGTH=263 /DNA_ID=CAMNT_0043940497 /DNA_START=21 /DNA_END=812 /DNA_ORIENTATION=-
MSFQDFGKNRSSNNNRPQQPRTAGASSGATAIGNGTSSSVATISEGYGSVSNGILQYQRNVGILSKIIANVGVANASVTENQFNVQVDVIRQLGSKIEVELKEKEQSMMTMSRTDASRSRATYTKLTRDYRHVESTFKNLLLDAKRKRNNLESQLREEAEMEQRKQFEEGVGHDTARLQMQIKDDRINDEIMREREEEIRNINKGMHQVNEIYKDLAHIIGSQQEQVDEVEEHMERANESAEAGLKQIEKANTKASTSSCLIC